MVDIVFSLMVIDCGFGNELWQFLSLPFCLPEKRHAVGNVGEASATPLGISRASRLRLPHLPPNAVMPINQIAP